MISFKPENPYSTESTRMVHGIMFILPSRQRFIPYSWLTYSEVNEKETEIQFHYTHTVVTVTGTNLRFIHESVIRYELLALRELTPPASARANGPTVSRIEITEKALEG
jgi:hypothetical protein